MVQKMNTQEKLQSGIHLILAAAYLAAVYVDYEIWISNRMFLVTGREVHTSFGGRFKFLTYIDMVIYLNLLELLRMKKRRENENIQNAFYLITAGLYALAVHTDWEMALNDAPSAIGLDFHKTFGGRLKFLTFIDMNIQAVYFSLCAFNVLMRIFSTKSKQIDNICNALYTSLVFPVGAIVTILFWGIYAVDRDLIYPEILEKVIPSYQNHLVHTLPLIGAVLDSYVTKHYYHKSLAKGITGTVVFLLTYLVWVFIIAFYGGFWVYPILKVLSPFYRGIFVAASAVFGAILYKIGEVTNDKFWPPAKSRSFKKKS